MYIIIIGKYNSKMYEKPWMYLLNKHSTLFSLKSVNALVYILLCIIISYIPRGGIGKPWSSFPPQWLGGQWTWVLLAAQASKVHGAE